MKINIVGAGRVGQTLGKLLSIQSCAVSSIYNRTKLTLKELLHLSVQELQLPT